MLLSVCYVRLVYGTYALCNILLCVFESGSYTIDQAELQLTVVVRLAPNLGVVLP